MIRFFLAYFAAFAIFYFCIPAYRELSGKETWDLGKLFFFSILLAILAIGFLSLLMFLF